MKPFNLEAALKGEPVVNREGDKVVFIAYDKGAHTASQLIVRCEDEGSSTKHYADGTLWHGRVSNKDLFMAPKTKVFWVNVYDDGSIGSNYDTEENANTAAEHTSKYSARRVGPARRVEIEY